MSDDTTPIPGDLKDRLQEEPADVQADLEAVWSALGAAKDRATEEADPDAAWSALVRHHPELDAPPSDGTNAAAVDRTSAPSASRRRERSAQSPQRQTRWRIAAGLALAALVLMGGLWLWRQPVTVGADPGQQRTVSLPDGSTVELNSGTTLTYRRGFRAWPLVDADRRVRLAEPRRADLDGADGQRAPPGAHASASRGYVRDREAGPPRIAATCLRLRGGRQRPG